MMCVDVISLLATVSLYSWSILHSPIEMTTMKTEPCDAEYAMHRGMLPGTPRKARAQFYLVVLHGRIGLV